MGREVSRLPAGDRLGRPDSCEPAPAAEAPFGAWFARERRCRLVPVEFVSAITRIPAGRIVALEEVREQLPADGGGRAMARALAQAIGADPREAAARVGSRPGTSQSSRLRLRPPSIRALALVLLTLGAGLAAWRVASTGDDPRSVPVVHRKDHVARLLESEE